MYFPDCRTDEAYSEKYLNKNDREYVRGYDYAVEEVLENAFANLDCMDLDVDGEDIDLGKILTNHPNIADKFKEELKIFFESSRNEIIVSLIEGMDDSEYQHNKEISDSNED